LDQESKLEVVIEGTGDYHGFLTLESSNVPSSATSNNNPSPEPEPKLDSQYYWENICVESLDFSQAYTTGSGIFSDPYLITDWFQWDLMRYAKSTTGLDGIHFALDNDLNADTDGYALIIEENFNPIVNAECDSNLANHFTHHLNGMGFSIQDVIFSINTQTSGLFKSISGVSIENIDFSNANITTSGFSGLLAGDVYQSTISGISILNSRLNFRGAVSGGLVGRVSNSTIQNIQIISEIIAGAHSIGGLVGVANDQTSISHLYVESNIGEFNFNFLSIGGVAGQMNDSTLSYANFYGHVKGWNNIGGLVGNATSSLIDRSQVIKGSTIEGLSKVGGAIGTYLNYTPIDITILEQVAIHAIVKGGTYTGGLIGQFGFSNNTIYDGGIVIDTVYLEVSLEI